MLAEHNVYSCGADEGGQQTHQFNRMRACNALMKAGSPVTWRSTGLLISTIMGWDRCYLRHAAFFCPDPKLAYDVMYLLFYGVTRAHARVVHAQWTTYEVTMKNPATSQQVLANALPASELTAP